MRDIVCELIILLLHEQVPATQWQLCLGGSLIEPETVNRKGLQVRKSLEASPALKN
jgi:hypothetical protein